MMLYIIQGQTGAPARPGRPILARSVQAWPALARSLWRAGLPAVPSPRPRTGLGWIYTGSCRPNAACRARWVGLLIGPLQKSPNS
jgi:hypothetical protein